MSHMHTWLLYGIDSSFFLTRQCLQDSYLFVAIMYRLICKIIAENHKNGSKRSKKAN